MANLPNEGRLRSHNRNVIPLNVSILSIRVDSKSHSRVISPVVALARVNAKFIVMTKEFRFRRRRVSFGIYVSLLPSVAFQPVLEILHDLLMCGPTLLTRVSSTG